MKKGYRGPSSKKTSLPYGRGADLTSRLAAGPEPWVFNLSDVSGLGGGLEITAHQLRISWRLGARGSLLLAELRRSGYPTRI